MALPLLRFLGKAFPNCLSLHYKAVFLMDNLKNPSDTQIKICMAINLLELQSNPS